MTGFCWNEAANRMEVWRFVDHHRVVIAVGQIGQERVVLSPVGVHYLMAKVRIMCEDLERG